jgi:NAD(P)-dependent dehydrogenase (short-subunit alcohol dehydrogenase family)
MMARISNEELKVLILTGASRGIGHATVKRFSTAGWRVITSRHPFPENCPWEAGPEDHIQVDLGDMEDTIREDTIRAIAEMKDRLKAQDSRLNALVNNAAISPKGERGSRLGTSRRGSRTGRGIPDQFLRAHHARPRSHQPARGGLRERC